METAELERIEGAVRVALPTYLADLARLVNIDCGSYTPVGVNEVGRWAGEFLAELGAAVEYRADPDRRLGDTVVATFAGQAGGRVSNLEGGPMDIDAPAVRQELEAIDGTIRTRLLY